MKDLTLIIIAMLVSAMLVAGSPDPADEATISAVAALQLFLSLACPRHTFLSADVFSAEPVVSNESRQPGATCPSHGDSTHGTESGGARMRREGARPCCHA